MRYALAAAALIVTGCATGSGAEIAPIAAAPAAATPIADAPIAVPAGAYALDPRHTSVVFRIRHMGLSLYTARFDKAAGVITLDPAAPSKSTVDATVDVASVSTGLRDKDGKLSFDGEIAKALGVEKTPQLRFVSKSVTRTGEKTGLVEGDLTMNGVTKPATMEVTFEDGKVSPLSGKMVVGFGGRMVIKRSDWGATQWALFAGDEVEILIQTEANKS
ncbi:MAG: YceI family protein [Hyphomonadaceae bacterium]